MLRSSRCSGLSEIRGLKLSFCSGCNRSIAPGGHSVKFPCPNCGGTTIWRCEKCRQFGRSYKCPKCGFTGP
ncbi:DUF1610 domain-containing protein [Candidatus Bathyarchaeota archaeon]|nr:DUF1610 domain-containing protein [Candidatus Bathyarchaeota archaeon]